MGPCLCSPFILFCNGVFRKLGEGAFTGIDHYTEDTNIFMGIDHYTEDKLAKS